MGAAFAYDISFLRYYQYEKEQDNDFPFILPTVLCLLFMASIRLFGQLS